MRMKEYHDLVVQHARTLESEVQERTAQLRTQYKETVYLMTSAALPSRPSLYAAAS